MSTQINNVLAVMQTAIECLECSNSARDIRAGIALVEARNAVIALIQAAHALLNATGRASCAWPIQSPQRVAWNRTDIALRIGCGGDLYNGTTDDVIRNALDRVGGTP